MFQSSFLTKIVFSIVVILFSLPVLSQHGTVITYLESGNIDMGDFADDFEQALKDKKDELMDSSKIDSLEAAHSMNKQALEQAMQMLTALRPADTVTAWIENNFLITKSTSNSAGQRLFYHLQTQKFLRVDSFTRDPMRKFDTTFRETLTCTDCTVTARLDKTAGTKMISGYACVKFNITQKFEGEEGGDEYTV
jgi:hypothetical protein